MQLNPQSTEFDQAVLSIAQSLFNKTPQLKKCHPQVNYCVVLHFDDATADRVIKFTNRNRWPIEVERYLYPAMREHGLPVPEIEFTQHDFSEPSEPFIVMPKFSDYTLNDLCDDGDRAALRTCEASGRFIQNLHERFAEAFKPFQAVEDLRGQLAAIQKGYDQEQDLILIREQEPELSQIIERHLATFSVPSTKRLIHGQPHTQNVLAGKSGEICVIDFGESIGMSSPLRDLYLLLSSHDGWSEGTGNQAQREAILKGYGGIDEAEAQELRYWEFSSYVKALRDHMVLALGPDSSQQLTDRIRTIAAGQSLLPLLWDQFD